MLCCGSAHPFDSRRVREKWWPAHPRCLIIGESPGRPGADYFYDPVPSGGPDPVVVRANLLRGLLTVGLIPSHSLEAFRDSGFIFDHVIRCQIPLDQVSAERDLAASYASQRGAEAAHLKPLVESVPKAWAMGNLARNAVVALYPDKPQDLRRITADPYPCHLPGMPTVFVSRYLSHIDFDEVKRIVGRFAAFFHA